MGCAMCVNNEKSENNSTESSKNKLRWITLYNFGFDTISQTTEPRRVYTQQDSFLNENEFQQSIQQVHYQVQLQHSQNERELQSFHGHHQSMHIENSSKKIQKYEKDSQEDRYNFSDNYYERKQSQDEENNNLGQDTQQIEAIQVFS